MLRITGATRSDRPVGTIGGREELSGRGRGSFSMRVRPRRFRAISGTSEMRVVDLLPALRKSSRLGQVVHKRLVKSVAGSQTDTDGLRNFFALFRLQSRRHHVPKKSIGEDGSPAIDRQDNE